MDSVFSSFWMPDSVQHYLGNEARTVMISGNMNKQVAEQQKNGHGDDNEVLAEINVMKINATSTSSTSSPTSTSVLAEKMNDEGKTTANTTTSATSNATSVVFSPSTTSSSPWSSSNIGGTSNGGDGGSGNHSALGSSPSSSGSASGLMYQPGLSPPATIFSSEGGDSSYDAEIADEGIEIEASTEVAHEGPLFAQQTNSPTSNKHDEPPVFKELHQDREEEEDATASSLAAETRILKPLTLLAPPGVAQAQHQVVDEELEPSPDDPRTPFHHPPAPQLNSVLVQAALQQFGGFVHHTEWNSELMLSNVDFSGGFARGVFSDNPEVEYSLTAVFLDGCGLESLGDGDGFSDEDGGYGGTRNGQGASTMWTTSTQTASDLLNSAGENFVDYVSDVARWMEDLAISTVVPPPTGSAATSGTCTASARREKDDINININQMDDNKAATATSTNKARRPTSMTTEGYSTTVSPTKSSEEPQAPPMSSPEQEPKLLRPPWPPSALRPLLNLQQAYLMRNRLTEIRAIDFPPSLRILDVSENLIARIELSPNDSSEMTTATSTSRSRSTSRTSASNYYIRQQVQHPGLPRLQQLNLSRNRIKSLDDIHSVHCLPALALLDVAENPFSSKEAARRVEMRSTPKQASAAAGTRGGGEMNDLLIENPMFLQLVGGERESEPFPPSKSRTTTSSSCSRINTSTVEEVVNAALFHDIAAFFCSSSPRDRAGTRSPRTTRSPRSRNRKKDPPSTNALMLGGGGPNQHHHEASTDLLGYIDNSITQEHTRSNSIEVEESNKKNITGTSIRTDSHEIEVHRPLFHNLRSLRVFDRSLYTKTEGNPKKDPKQLALEADLKLHLHNYREKIAIALPDLNLLDDKVLVWEEGEKYFF